MKTVFISVVRNKEMYRNFVKDNPYNKEAEFVWYDNTKENIVIPKRYNDFLNTYDYKKPAWFVFCHEDWQTKSPWLHQLKKLNKNALYGVCGARLIVKNNQYAQKYFLGEIIGSDKKGQNVRTIGAVVKTGTLVDTFDCVCLIVHSSLIKKHNIRFDENLTWHLYAEEMSIRLKEQLGIPSCILQIHSQHYSLGNADESFDRSFDYLVQKFGNTKQIYSGTVTNQTIMPTRYIVESVIIPKVVTTYISLFGFHLWKKTKFIDCRNKRKKNNKRVDLSICAIAKNEAQYIKEWLDYHLFAGVKRFYIYDNESDDNLQEILAPYIKKKIVIYKYWPGKAQQLYVYNDCIQKCVDETQWLALIDCDEFIVPIEKDSIPEFLEDYTDFSGVAINWMMFDSNGHMNKPEGSVLKNYTRVHLDDQDHANHHIKCIVQPSKGVYAVSPHFCIYSRKETAVTENKEFLEVGSPFTKTVSFNKIRINHYCSKSREDYMNKINRGRGDTGTKANFSEEMFIFPSHKQDTTILKYLQRIKKYSKFFKKGKKNNA